MGINHGGFDILVPEQLLHRADIVDVFEKVGGEGVAEGVRADTLFITEQSPEPPGSRIFVFDSNAFPRDHPPTAIGESPCHEDRNP